MMATTAQLRAVLLLPATVRPMLLVATAQTRLPPAHLFSTSSRYAAPKYKYHNIAALLIPEYSTSPIAEVSPAELFKSSSLPSAPGKPIDEELTRLFTINPAEFASAGSNFYNLKKNTRIPEVCILGRSNVGKSSFVNALANRQSSHLANVSKRAGRTRSINSYGFGPAPSMKDLVGQAAIYKGKEDIPKHAFHLVDMPGYGKASREEWGRNIALYLQKRSAIKGAIVLIDAEVGPKDTDWQLLHILSAAKLRTTIVLTKADKLRTKGLERLRETCQKLWDGLKAIESRLEDREWVWEKEILVTAVGANDHSVVKSTVTTARLAVARLAGLVKDKRPEPEVNKKWSGQTISFDDLQYAPGNATAPKASKSGTPKSSFGALEQASKSQHAHHTIKSRSFSTHAAWSNRPFDTGDSLGVQRMLDEFLEGLRKRAARKTPKDVIRMRALALEREPPRATGSLQEYEERQYQRLRRKFPDHFARGEEVYERRLRIEEHRARERYLREVEAQEEAEGSEKKSKRRDKTLDQDAFLGQQSGVWIEEDADARKSRSQKFNEPLGDDWNAGDAAGTGKQSSRFTADDFNSALEASQGLGKKGKKKGRRKSGKQQDDDEDDEDDTEDSFEGNFRRRR
ncbi:hypothetical protein F4780DRAFT_765688 [Xylariomycetidae sp. FL0641]|nr:hypothetical protein F4780DRAFT_765688 [Xylariomycetidae sp. FL0641]